jgi:hypothetical protein
MSCSTYRTTNFGTWMIERRHAEAIIGFPRPPRQTLGKHIPKAFRVICGAWKTTACTNNRNWFGKAAGSRFRVHVVTCDLIELKIDLMRLEMLVDTLLEQIWQGALIYATGVAQ